MLSGHRTKAHDKTKRDKTDKYSGTYYNQEVDFKMIDRLQQVADRLGLPAAQVALAWLLSKPAITAPIVGATKPGHIEDAVAAIAVQLTDDDIKQLEELYVPHLIEGF